MLKGKHVLLGVTGSIAAYKIANLASMLIKHHAEVTVIMTQNATNFIHPTAFETITGRKCLIDTFDRNFDFSVEHISIAEWADVVLIAPASADIIAKMAHGIADDMLTTTILACQCKKLISPAMNTRMYENPIVVDNLKTLENYGFEMIPADSGRLACGSSGAGKMPPEELLFSYIQREIALEKDMKGKKVLITAGPTQEAIDPVRFISNHSTGKMGYALAKIAMLRGADVTLISGPVSIKAPEFVHLISVKSAKEMFQAVCEHYEEQDIIIKAAAVADYRPAQQSDEKIKKSDSEMKISLERTDDILKFLGEHKKEHQFLCGFSMETQKLIENSRKKLEKKNADMIAANNLKVEGAGFGTDTNIVTLITKEDMIELPKLSKEDTAGEILSEIMKHFF